MAMSEGTRQLVEALVEKGHCVVELSMQHGNYTVVVLNRKVKSKEAPVAD